MERSNPFSSISVAIVLDYIRDVSFAINMGKMTRCFQPDPAQNFSIAITTLRENRSQINRTLIYFFQPDPA
jgi:hypothetical protein